MPIFDFDIFEPAGAGGWKHDAHWPSGPADAHAAIAPEADGGPFTGRAIFSPASPTCRAERGEAEISSIEVLFRGSVLTLSATLRTPEAHGPINSAIADTVG